MKKIKLTEAQLKAVIDTVVNEMAINEAKKAKKVDPKPKPKKVAPVKKTGKTKK